MITGRQIRAARALLEWDAEDLAHNAGLNRDTVFNIEKGLVRPQEKTLARLVSVFDRHGIEFTEDEGVRIRKNQVRIFSGKEGYKQFLDHIYDTVKDTGGKIRQFNLSDGKNLPHAAEYAKIHMDRMSKVEHLDARVLTIEGDYNFPAPYCVYRWLRKENKILMPYYVYNDFIEMPIYRTEHNVEVISIRSQLLAEKYVEQFELFWDTAIVPPKKGSV
jgi:DNA-binding XRE family transcriptional regulator